MLGVVYTFVKVLGVFAIFGTAFIDFDNEHRFLELFPVARHLPQLAVDDLRRVHFDIAASPLLAAHVILQFGVDRPAVRMPENLARRLFLHVEQAHFAAQLAVIAFGRFFQHVQMRFELFLAGKGATVNPLQHFAV